MDINYKILRTKIREYLDEFYVYKNSNTKSDDGLFENIKYMNVFLYLLEECIDKVKIERQVDIYNKHKKNVKNVSNNVANVGHPLKEKCVGIKIDAKNYLGKGRFGTVYQISPTIVVKLSNLYVYTDAFNENPGDEDSEYCKENLRECLENEYELAKKAAKLGVSPKVYDTYICKVSETEFYNVTFMENIAGVTYNEWMDSQPPLKDINTVNNLIIKKIKKLQENNIMHSDIHGANMKVIKKNGKFDVVILDFGKAKTAGSLTTQRHFREQGWLNEFYFKSGQHPIIKYEEHKYVIYKLFKNNYLKIKM